MRALRFRGGSLGALRRWHEHETTHKADQRGGDGWDHACTVGALRLASLLLSGVWMWPRTTVGPEGEDVRCGSAGAAWVPCVGPRMSS